jgi:periplasmic protein TonB
MFSNLVESAPKGARRQAGTVASFVAHYVLIVVLLYTSAHAETTKNRPRIEKVVFVEQPRQPEAPRTRPADVVAPRPRRLDPVLVPPVEVPTTLPEIDSTRPVADPDAFSRGASAATAAAADTAEVTVDPTATFLEFQVEQPAMQAPNSAIPVYPEILRQAGVEGEALVSFVVDTSGRVDVATFKVVRASHDLFAAAVRNALPRMRFIPAAVGDRKVRQLVQQPFAFAIQRFSR